MHIAIIGTGISGLTAAYLLHNDGHDVHIFDKADRIGGHTHTVDIQLDQRIIPTDAAFSVFNAKAYPNFARLIKRLGIETQPVFMSFSISSESSQYEYGTQSWTSLFAHRSNLLSPKHWAMIRDIRRFNFRAQHDLFACELTDDMTVGEYVTDDNYTEHFIHYYLVPLGCAIWSASPQEIYSFPLRTFVNYLNRNGLLDSSKSPQWLSIRGGANTYLPKLVEGFEDAIHLNAGVQKIKRLKKGPTLIFEDGTRETFDEVILSCHANQALELLDKPSDIEQSTLQSFTFRQQKIALHSDTNVLPESEEAAGSWNYMIDESDEDKSVVTHNRGFMTLGKSNGGQPSLNVTLNANQLLEPDKVFGKYTYTRFLLTQEAVEAQKNWEDINGQQHTWFCGAYWGQGFHEDGCRSGIRVAKALGARCFI